MSDNRLYITFSSPNQILTYGPESTDKLSSIMYTLKSHVGGFANAHDRIKNDYRIVWLGIPDVAYRMYELDPETFYAFSGMPWRVDHLGLTNFKFSTETDWPSWEEQREIPMIDRTTNAWELEYRARGGRI